MVLASTAPSKSGSHAQSGTKRLMSHRTLCVHNTLYTHAFVLEWTSTDVDCISNYRCPPSDRHFTTEPHFKASSPLCYVWQSTCAGEPGTMTLPTKQARCESAVPFKPVQVSDSHFYASETAHPSGAKRNSANTINGDHLPENLLRSTKRLGQ